MNTYRNFIYKMVFSKLYINITYYERTTVWRSTAKIRSLRSDPYNQILTIRSLRSDPYDQILTIRSLRSYPYDQILTIRSLRSDPYDQILTIRSLRSDPYALSDMFCHELLLSLLLNKTTEECSYSVIRL